MQKNKGFEPPIKFQRQKALGDLKREDQDLINAVEDVDVYWKPIRRPKHGDWLDVYPHKGQSYDEFKGRRIKETKNVLYLLPIL